MKRYRAFMLSLSIAVVLMSTGCATMMSGSTQTIAINSNPPGAHVAIAGQTAITPAIISVPKGRDYRVVVSRRKDRRIIMLNREVDPATYYNFIPPLWPGFIVDAANGTMTRYEMREIFVDFKAPPGRSTTQLVRFRD